MFFEKNFRNIASLHPHPKYNPRQYAFDIMVIKTVTPFQLGRAVIPIKLADQGYDPIGNGVMSIEL
jgi:hypothetical protein